MYRAGIRELRLSQGRHADWYYEVTRKCLRSIVHSHIVNFGADSFVEGLSEPYFFDFLVVASGLDELEGDSTTILGAILKESVFPESGVAVLGGLNLTRFQVPKELRLVADYFGLSEREVDRLLYCSRMVAKIDSVAIQDGHEIYFHMMLLSRSRMWTIVQQSSNPLTAQVKRYHWFSGHVQSFVNEPHSGIVAKERQKIVLDMTARESEEARRVSVELLNSSPSKLRRVQAYSRMLRQTQLCDDPETATQLDFLGQIGNISWSLLDAVSRSAPNNYEELLAVRGVGREIVKLLALGCKVFHNVSPSFRDRSMLAPEITENYGAAEVLSRLQEVVDAIKASGMDQGLKNRALSRLAHVYGETEDLAG